MANTYNQIYIHLVFAVKYRDAVISQSWRQELYKYITGLIGNRGHKVYAIGGMSDHIHILISLSPKQSISELVLEIKRASTLWIKERGYVKCQFAWQEGFGAFSYGMSQIDNVVRYIQNQEIHHAKRSFRNEYVSFLELFNVEYNEKYIFHEME
ncbi:MAG: IS200/IS605 family transposase [Paludibacteraceae bacterium]|nr:IS200/IS605 family transposase [Paludibacteraceae bacterium]MBR5973062.1 IS200/IS605 family transposase [Paludibacteraceae bacterium]